MPIHQKKTWQQLLDAILVVNSADNHSSFGEAVVAALSQLVVADVTIFQVLDKKTQRIVTQVSPSMPYTAEEVAYYVAHSDENPLASYYTREGDPKALRMSDVIDQKEWEASMFYRTCCQRLGLAYSLVLPVNVDASVVVALSFDRRSADFTREDCELLDAFGPHLRQAWKRHENPWADRREIERRERLKCLGLSPRESEVLFWMTEGKLNREIATLLGLTLGTVQDNVSRILSKLQLENRHAATVFAIAKLQQR
jgi:DNA-binding CsgD family transcriptional regulator